METVLRQPSSLEQPSSVRRPSFPKSLMEDHKFVDPFREVQRTLLVSEQTTVSPIISLEIAQATAPKGAMRSESFFSTIYAYLSMAITHLKRKFGRNRRARARLTRLGSDALSQLQYLSLLCEATSCGTPDEALTLQSAFGEAYYEIMTLSANLEKMTEREGEHHLRNYSRQMTKILHAAD
ncbi:MAG: hypothetical protein WCT52_05105 [Candidatus Micrarchaeia archaeon]